MRSCSRPIKTSGSLSTNAQSAMPLNANSTCVRLFANKIFWGSDDMEFILQWLTTSLLKLGKAAKGRRSEMAVK